MLSESSVIHVCGARVHNLRGIDVEIPRNRLTVITGVSGSGKSSLAFDTIHAEGQRRYVESLSVHARQFLQKLPAPEVERIDGLSPTVAIQQRRAAASPRSTVATATELHDFLRVLFARAGTPHCWICDKPIRCHAVGEIVDELMQLPPDTRLMVLAPLIVHQTGAHKAVLQRLAREGYVRARIDGHVVALEDIEPLDAKQKHTIEVVIDRIVVKPGIESRLADSLELCMRLSDGAATIARSTDGRGTYADARYSEHFACADHPEVRIDDIAPRLFSFNSPHGACPTCSGLGVMLEFDADLIVPNRKLSLADGAVAPWRHRGTGRRRLARGYEALLAEFCTQFDVPPDMAFDNLSAKAQRILLHGTASYSKRKTGPTFEGAVPNLRRRWETSDSDAVRQRLHAYLTESPCTSCHGARLRPEALAVRVGQSSIADICRMTIEQARAHFDGVRLDAEHAEIAEGPLREIRHRLRFLCDVGVEYLTLDRSAASLSGGEAQRIHLATQIGGGLVGVCYVLDEPTVGLHQRDSQRLADTLRRLVDVGNTVIVVEHDQELIAAADHLIDIGPGAGERGGKLVAHGSRDDIIGCAASITGDYLAGRRTVRTPQQRRSVNSSHWIEVRGARANNLKNLNARIPLGCLVAVTGVSGSGKSTLVVDVLLHALRNHLARRPVSSGLCDDVVGADLIEQMIEVDQSPIGQTPRSNPVTFAGIFSSIRAVFARTREAKLRGYDAGRFSFNARGGRCESCRGQGTRRVEMHFLPDVFVTCTTCRGTRYNRETLDVRYRGKSIADVLDMPVSEAAEFFTNFRRIARMLQALLDVGLGYVRLGQPSTTLSGGEAQRVKLAAELGKPTAGHTLYVLDEPTTGLHFADVHKLLDVLNRLVSEGHTAMVIEHNLDVIKQADWVIDLGPGAGDRGGSIVAAGSPEDVTRCSTSVTGRYLAQGLDQSTAASTSASFDAR